MMDREESAAQESPDAARSRGLFSGLRIVSLCTLLSRVLGLVREMAMAALFGNGRVLDAFTVAFAIPNLARALFGEGALSTAFLPLFVREQELRGREAANRLASAVFLWTGIGLTGLVAAAELLLAGLLWLVPLSPDTRLWLTLTALMLPYLILICMTAQVGAVLNACGRFAWPALLPVIFNLCSLAAIWFVQQQELSAEAQASWLAAAVLLTGAVQLLVPWRQLRRCGFRFDSRWRDVKDRLSELLNVMGPIVLGLSITQFNTLCDRLIALGLSQPEVVVRPTEEGLISSNAEASARRAWQRLPSGTASALNQGQRLYQFPLGLLGVALGTVIFPLLSRHAERGEWRLLRDDLALGLRLVFVIGIPASAGLWLLADELAVVIFQHGRFDATDARQTADMIAGYGLGVWAFCGLLIVQRGFYALGDRRTPLKIGLFVVLMNLLLNVVLIFVIGARGLALSTSLCGITQFGLCLLFVQDRVGRMPWRPLVSSAGRAVLATLVMTVCANALRQHWKAIAQTDAGPLIPLGVTVCGAVTVYALMAWLLRLKEFWLLFRRRGEL